MKYLNLSFVIGMLAVALAAPADVSVSTEAIRTRSGKATDWQAVRLDSGRSVYELRFDGHRLGLGPDMANWYGNGFLTVSCGRSTSSRSQGVLEIPDRGPALAQVRVRWIMAEGKVEATFTLHDGDDKLLVTLDVPESERRRVRVQCYPSSMAGGWRPGKAIRRRHGMTAVRDVVLDEGEHVREGELTANEPWVLFMDDHFDVAEGRGVGPCAALYLPHEMAAATMRTGNYACYLDLRPAPGVDTIHLALWEFRGTANADAMRFMRGLELVAAH